MTKPLSRRTKAAMITLAAFFILLAAWWTVSSRWTTDTSPESFQLMGFLETHHFFELPGFELRNIDGQSVPLEKLPRNKVYIVNFWATWCEPCAEEFPSMVKLVAHFKDDIEFIAISNDSSIEDIQTFSKAFELDRSPHIKIFRDEKSDLMKLFKVGKLPESFIFDQKGRLVKKIVGTRNWYAPDAIEYFQDLLKEH